LPLRALEGIRVVSFNHFLMGPLGVQFLADLGADVIAIEPVDGAFQRKWGGCGIKTVDGQTTLFLAANRNKRSLALDLRNSRGLAIAKRLISRADVVSENYRPGVMDKLGIGFDDCRQLKPDIVYAAGSGFGPDGPYVDRPGQDLIIQAMSGLAHITGTREHGPRAVGVSAVDHHGAALLAAGILAALLRRERTGQGSRVDVNLLSAAIHLQTESFINYANGEKPDDVRQPYPLGGWYFDAPYGVYRTADGHLAVSLGSLEGLQAILDIPEDQRVGDQDSFRLREKAAAGVAVKLAERSTEHWVELFTRHKIWHSKVNDYEAVMADPQIRHNQSFATVEGATGAPITLVGHPIRYDGEVPQTRQPPQKLGAQTSEILRELGCSDEEIAALVRENVVAAPA
jgi:crotonobetainyl-CoA:carnitine CoA-transferase CaiB-like acyl-CoA transferase